MDHIFYFAWEPEMIAALQQVMGPVLTAAASFITMFGEELILIAVLGFLYWCCDKEYAKFIGTNIVACVMINPMLKEIVMRPRPYMVHEEIQCLRAAHSGDIYDIKAQGYSFPSGHAMNSATIYGSLSSYQSRVKGHTVPWLLVLAFVLPFLVGLSRILLGVHYPTDILAGWAVGALIAVLLTEVHKRIRHRSVFHIILVILALPGIAYCRTSEYYTALGLMIGFFLALPFEEKFVRFEEIHYGKDKQAILWTVLRIAGGMGVYFLLNKLLKLPFSEEFLDSQQMAAFLVRTVRYTIVTFAAIGVYPMVFRLVERRKA